MTSVTAKLTVSPKEPVITVQPANQDVSDGEKAVFTVAATGDDLSYQWQVNKTGMWNNCTSSGNNTATFSFTARPSYSGWQYRCMVVNSYGSVVSDAVTLTVAAIPPAITAQPTAQNVKEGEKATFTVKASGSDLTYQWQVNKTGTWNDCTSSGNKTATFSFTALTMCDGWQYRCVVTNAAGSVTSDEAVLTVAPLAPVLTKQPVDQNVTEGEKAVFAVTATGDDLTYQWQVNKTGTWNNCTNSGNKTATFSFTAQPSLTGWQYRCVVTNSYGSVTSDEVTLTVATIPPVITKQPVDQNMIEGEKAVFAVTASGSDLTYQWQINKTGTWNNCTSSGNKTATFSFSTKVSYSGWQYRCVVNNPGGSVITNVVRLTVTPDIPVITKQPVDQNVAPGGRATFTVTATGNNLTYQWQVNKTGSWNDCTSAGNDTDTFSFKAQMSLNGWQYRCVITNPSGIVTTDEVSLTVTEEAPLITAQPAPQEVKTSKTARFSVAATGDNLDYQWQVNKTGTWKDCTSPGNDTATFSFTTQTSFSGWQYRCVVSNTSGTEISNAVTLTVNPRRIYLSPSNQEDNTFITGNANEGEVWNDIAVRLEALLAEYECEVMISEYDMILQDRAVVAKQWDADVYVAMHSNAYSSPNSAWGVEVYYDANKADSAERKALAQALLDELSTLFNKRGLVTSSSLKDCRLPEMPSVIVECGYHDTVSDANKILNNKDLIAELYCNALVRYLDLKQRAELN